MMRKIIIYIRCLYANKAAFSCICLMATSGVIQGVFLWSAPFIWVFFMSAGMLFTLTYFGFDTYNMYMRTTKMLEKDNSHQDRFLEIMKNSLYCRQVGGLLALKDWQKRRPQ